jgi:hypothetical protein
MPPRKEGGSVQVFLMAEQEQRDKAKMHITGGSLREISVPVSDM